MRLVRARGGNTGLILESDGRLDVLDIAAAGEALRADEPHIADGVQALFDDRRQSWLPMIRRWTEARETLRLLAEHSFASLRNGIHALPLTPLSELDLEPPLPDPGSRIFAMGGNFPAHASKMSGVLNLPASVTNSAAHDAPPWGFYVIPGTVVGPNQTIVAPSGTKYLDYEAEVAVVLGNDAHDELSAQFWGYTAWNDFSIRDAALGTSQTDHGPLTWSLTKNFRTGNSCGPWMVVNHPPVDNLSITCHVNDELRQSGSTAQMAHSFGRIASYISEFVPLGAGDMILSGTPPGTAIEGGVDGAFLQTGDHVDVRIDGVDTLHNVIGAGE
jgi:2-keto-4-pentenoate hydratase/2-oxohepta-3-ene-1,7-dioic acid hydratase in catechol pathway